MIIQSLGDNYFKRTFNIILEKSLYSHISLVKHYYFITKETLNFQQSYLFIWKGHFEN